MFAFRSEAGASILLCGWDCCRGGAANTTPVCPHAARTTEAQSAAAAATAATTSLSLPGNASPPAAPSPPSQHPRGTRGGQSQVSTTFPDCSQLVTGLSLSFETKLKCDSFHNTSTLLNPVSSVLTLCVCVFICVCVCVCVCVHIHVCIVCSSPQPLFLSCTCK